MKARSALTSEARGLIFEIGLLGVASSAEGLEIALAVIPRNFLGDDVIDMGLLGRATYSTTRATLKRVSNQDSPASGCPRLAPIASPV
jgi:hypothetical protein